MANWDPPQIGGTPDIPIIPVPAPNPWWKRRYRRLPLWGWMAGGVLALAGVSTVLPPVEPDQLAGADIASTTDVMQIASTVVATTAPSSTVALTPATTSPRAVVTQPRVVATTEPRSTTAPPTTVVVTLPPSTTIAPTTTTTSTTTTTAPPPPPTIAVQPFIPQSDCDPNYTGCVPIDTDVDCAGGSGNGPSYADGPVTVIGDDIYGLDGDGDGIGCE